MNFKNTPNKRIVHEGTEYWISRSVAVNGVIIAIKNKQPFVLCARRGPNSADFQGKMNLVAGYLDWDETGTEALIRETWEEVGLDLFSTYENNKILQEDLFEPWAVKTEPSQNRQNVSLRYGLIVKMDDETELPDLSIENNEVDGETETPMWLRIDYVENYEWAFDHDKLIYEYYANRNYE